nr:hypothetical protein [[Limnothrix rosea] IAM M-220]
MATVFVLITSQAIAISALYRIRAQRQSEALQWIQNDFSDIKFAALQNLTGANCDAVNADNGYAAALARAVTDPSITVDWSATAETIEPPDTPAARPNITLLNKSYSAVRTLSVFPDPPFHVMTVSYSITDPESTTLKADGTANNEIASFYTEVIPDAAFSCQ